MFVGVGERIPLWWITDSDVTKIQYSILPEEIEKNDWKSLIESLSLVEQTVQNNRQLWSRPLKINMADQFPTMIRLNIHDYYHKPLYIHFNYEVKIEKGLKFIFQSDIDPKEPSFFIRNNSRWFKAIYWQKDVNKSDYRGLEIPPNDNMFDKEYQNQDIFSWVKQKDGEENLTVCIQMDVIEFEMFSRKVLSTVGKNRESCPSSYIIENTFFEIGIQEEGDLIIELRLEESTRVQIISDIGDSPEYAAEKQPEPDPFMMNMFTQMYGAQKRNSIFSIKDTIKESNFKGHSYRSHSILSVKNNKKGEENIYILDEEFEVHIEIENIGVSLIGKNLNRTIEPIYIQLSRIDFFVNHNKMYRKLQIHIGSIDIDNNSSIVPPP